VQVGRLGELTPARGYYVYIGSAFGPGGVAARVARHHRVSKTRHWHIDYLRSIMVPAETWYSHDPERHEHEWAGVFLDGWRRSAPIEGFGASDCRCRSHLFFVGDRPELYRFRRTLARRTGKRTKIDVYYPEESLAGDLLDR
jgi:Uri superfamily endonuclease